MIARLHLRRMAQLAALVTMFAAGSPRARGAQSSPDARVYDCADLVTEQEIDRVIGQRGTKLRFGSGDAQDPSGPGYTECDYDLPGGFVLGVAVFTGEAREHLDQAWTRSSFRGYESGGCCTLLSDTARCPCL